MKLGLMLSPMATANTTRHLAMAFHSYAPDGVTIRELPLGEVPVQPPYEDMPIPAGATAWKQQISEVDGLVVVAVGEGRRPSFLALQHARTVLTDAGANVQKRPDYAIVLNPDSFTPDGFVADRDLSEVAPPAPVILPPSRRPVGPVL